MSEISRYWFELCGIDDNPVLAVEAELAKEREKNIEDALELQRKQEGVTKEVLEKGVTEFTESDEQKPVEPIKEELDERLFANFEESCDEELDEDLFGDPNKEENPVERINPSRPFNVDDYKTEDEARLAFEIYMTKKYGKSMNEDFEDSEAFCPMSDEKCKPVEQGAGMDPVEKFYVEEGEREAEETLTEDVDEEEEYDSLKPPAQMWKYQGGEGLSEDYLAFSDEFDDQGNLIIDPIVPTTTPQCDLSCIADTLNQAQTVAEIVELVTNAIPEEQRGQKSITRFLGSLPNDKSVEKAQQHVNNFILADKDGTVKEPIVDDLQEDFLDNIINQWSKTPKQKRVTESLKLLEGRGERNIEFLYTWFDGNDSGDWGKAYEQLLELNSPNALAEYKKLSDSAKAYLAQVEFNRLPNDVIALVDRNANQIWLARRAQPKGVEQLQSDFTQEDRQILPHVQNVTTVWAGRAKQLAGMG